jgi:thioredoxin 1
MKKITKMLIPITAALVISVTASYFESEGGCSCHAPLGVLGSIFGCGESKKPVAENTQVRVDNSQAAQEIVTDNKSGKTGLKVTFVEIGSVNCIPCRMMKPIMDAVEKEFAGQVKVVFHDVWTAKGKEDAMKYGIRVIPTQVFLDKDGKEYFRHQGFFPKEELVKILSIKGVK